MTAEKTHMDTSKNELVQILAKPGEATPLDRLYLAAGMIEGVSAKLEGAEGALREEIARGILRRQRIIRLEGALSDAVKGLERLYRAVGTHSCAAEVGGVSRWRAIKDCPCANIARAAHEIRPVIKEGKALLRVARPEGKETKSA